MEINFLLFLIVVALSVISGAIMWLGNIVSKIKNEPAHSAKWVNITIEVKNDKQAETVLSELRKRGYEVTREYP